MKNKWNTPLTYVDSEDLPPLVEPVKPAQRLINRRQIWAANRFWMEIYNMKTKRYGDRGHHHWYTLLILMKLFRFMARLTGQYQRGVANARNIALREIPLAFVDLPEKFDGFTILHLSDLHLDSIEGLEHIILQKLNNRSVDLCVMTGDYRTRLHGSNKFIIQKISYLIDRINSRNGFLGVLGNHDDCHMVNPFEKVGLQMLINSTTLLHRGSEYIRIIGMDDVHYYYTDQALHALEHADKGFSILLVHSPEIYDAAADMGVNLYLCGHTHAGQVCLPGGRPILTHLNRGRNYYKGRWKHGNMLGITHTGVGTSGIPVRFNSRGEILLLTLKRAGSPLRPSI